MTFSKLIPLALASFASLLTGCAFYTSELTIPTPGVAQTLAGESCAYNIFGLGMGTITLAEAMANADAVPNPLKPGQYPQPSDGTVGPTRPITRLSVAGTDDGAFLIGGYRCVTARGDDSEATPTTSAPEPKPHGGSDTDTGYDYRHRR
jgi:hypothetical protein